MTTYIAICFGYWGRGATEAEALKQLRKAGGGKRDKTVVYVVEHAPDQDKPWVDDYGTMCWHGERAKIAEIVNGKRIDCADASMHSAAAGRTNE